MEFAPATALIAIRTCTPIFVVLKHIFFTVTNDLNYDQRMRRICSTLAANGFKVTLVGRKLPGSAALEKKTYHQHRLNCWFSKGKAFYAEYNIRLFVFLFFKKMDAICAIDLDTILPCLYISRWKKIPRIYDAHELFTEMKEVISRPRIHKSWLRIEKKAVPAFTYGYTVSESIAAEFNKRYGVNYETIRNMPVLSPLTQQQNTERFLLYQGAVNEARGFEVLVPAMQKINCLLVVCGDGNFMPQLRELIKKHGLEHKIILKGMLPPDVLRDFAQTATIGIGIAEPGGLNQYLALPNKFFDYMHAALPQVVPDFPEYRKINDHFEIAVLLNDPSPEGIASAVNHLLQNDVLYNTLRQNCLKAREEFNWDREQGKLLSFYQSVFNH